MAMADQTDDKSGKQPQAPRERGGWLAKIAPGVRNLVAKRETPENLWVKCPDTGEMLYRPDLEAAMWVTPSGSHMRIGAAQRLRYTFDDGRFERIPSPVVADDPLKFPDDKPYADRLKRELVGVVEELGKLLSDRANKRDIAMSAISKLEMMSIPFRRNAVAA